MSNTARVEENQEKEIQQKELPFENLYLNSGYVSGFNAWWMYALTIMVTALCYALAPTITSFYLFIKAAENGLDVMELARNTSRLFDYRVIGVDKNVVVLSLLGIFVITALGFLTMLRRVHRKTLTSVMTGYDKFRFGRFWFAFTVWGVLLISGVVISYFVDPSGVTIDFDPFGFAVSLVMLFFLMPIQTGVEEVIFRGYLLQGLSQIFKNGFLPVIITSLLFGAAHMANPEVAKYGWPIMLTYYCVFGFFMGGLTLLDEGLELAFGIHFANNFISSLLVTSPDSVLQTHAIFSTEGDDPYTEIVLWFVMAAITFAIFWLKYRWKNFKLIIR